jgi:hypothetical protein
VTIKTYDVLLLCTESSVRGITADALLEHSGKGLFKA